MSNNADNNTIPLNTQLIPPATDPGDNGNTKTQPYNYKLNENHIKQLIAGVAKFYTENQIIEEFNRSNNGITISDSTLDLIKKTYKQDIGFVRNQWLARLADEPAVHKRVRVQKLWWLYQNLEKAIIDKPQDLKGLTYQASNVLQSIRVEVEGHQVNLNITPLHTLDDPGLLDKAKEIFTKHRAADADFIEIKPGQE